MSYADTFMTFVDDDGPVLTISAYKVHAVQRHKDRPGYCEVWYSLGDEAAVASGPVRKIEVKGEQLALGDEVVRKIGMWSGQAA